MTIAHRLTGYDNKTGRLAIEHDIPASKLKDAKELARISHENMGAIESYQIDVDRYSWFLEPFNKSDVEDTAA